MDVEGSLKDSSGDTGTSGQILSSTGTGLNWIDNSGGGDGDYSPYITGSVSTGILPTATSANNCTTIGNNSTIAGGTLNTASAACSFIGGGCNNTISNYYLQSIVGGADNCIVSSPCSIIGGGRYNTISSDYKPGNFIGGGDNNCIGSGDYNVIVGGLGNDINVGQDHSFNGILGGAGNLIPNGIDKSFIVGSNITASTDCTTFVNNLTITGSQAGNGILTFKRFESTPTNLEEGSVFHSGSANAGCLYFSPDGSAICKIAFV